MLSYANWQTQDQSYLNLRMQKYSQGCTDAGKNESGLILGVLIAYGCISIIYLHLYYHCS